MDREKQQLASAIKQQVDVLQAAISSAEAAGLTVRLKVPNEYALDSPAAVQVEVSVKVIYQAY